MIAFSEVQCHIRAGLNEAAALYSALPYHQPEKVAAGPLAAMPLLRLDDLADQRIGELNAVATESSDTREGSDPRKD